jgi:hypothetical protein
MVPYWYESVVVRRLRTVVECDPYGIETSLLGVESWEQQREVGGHLTARKQDDRNKARWRSSVLYFVNGINVTVLYLAYGMKKRSHLWTSCQQV